DAPGHVSLVVAASDDLASTAPLPSLTAEQAQHLRKFLEPRRLLTTILHVVGPKYMAFKIHLTVVPRPDVLPRDLRANIQKALADFFDPMHEEAGKDWPFGRSVYVSELYKKLREYKEIDKQIDYVTQIDLEPEDPARVLRSADQGNDQS